jgi:hypothetical protein
MSCHFSNSKTSLFFNHHYLQAKTDNKLGTIRAGQLLQTNFWFPRQQVTGYKQRCLQVYAFLLMELGSQHINSRNLLHVEASMNSNSSTKQ